MQPSARRQKQRGVVCRHCSRPIPLSSSILKREASLGAGEPETSQQWRSRVFTQRCRRCGVEAIYAQNLIVELDEPEPGSN